MLYLHIGRGKSGSTTIQAFGQQHREFLLKNGVHIPEHINDSGNHVALFESLRDASADQAPLLDLVGCLRDHQKVFVSSEFLIELDPDGVRRLQSALSGAPVRILCYIREYPGWIVSRYSQTVKKGRISVGFDTFFEKHRERLSVIPELNTWIDLFGVEQLYVRTIAQECLRGGDLITDLCGSLDIPSPPPATNARNVSPPWWQLELMRELHGAIGNELMSSELVQGRKRLLTLMDHLATKFGEPTAVQYMTPDQHRLAADRFAQDLTELSVRLNTPLAVPKAALGPRPFAPSFGALQEKTRISFLDRVRRAHANKPLPSILMIAIERLEAAQSC